MRIGDEVIGRRGGMVLAIVSMIGIALAIYGYGRGIAVGSSAALTRSLVVPSSGNPPKSNSPRVPSTRPPDPPGGTSSTTSANSGPTTSAPQNTTSTSSTAQKLGPALSSTQYASVSYQVYPGPISQQTSAALAGFDVTVKPSGNTETVSISVPGSQSAAQQTTYPLGDKVYFVEASFGDDSGNADYNGGDDGLIVTSPDGRVVE